MTDGIRLPVRLKQLPGFKVAENDPDIRGWAVLSTEGQTLGTVDELLVDMDAMRVSHVEILLLDRRNPPGRGRVVIPIGHVQVVQGASEVIVQPHPDLLSELWPDEAARAWLEGEHERMLREAERSPTDGACEASGKDAVENRRGGYRSGGFDGGPSAARHAGDEQTDPPPPRPGRTERGGGGMEA